MKIQPSQREKILIIATAGLLFVLVSVMIWKPLLRSWRATADQYRAKKQEFTLVQATIEHQPSYEKDYQKLIEALNNPNGPAAVPALGLKVEQLARDSGVTIRNSSTPQPPHDKEGFTEVAMDFSMDANLDSLVRLLFNIRTAQDLLDVKELKITPTPANAAILRADMRIVSLRAGGK